MTEIFKALFESGAFDEWNEWIAPIFVVLFLIDFVPRIFSRVKFRLQLTNVSKKWVKHKEERALERGDFANSSVVKINPHLQLNVLLGEFVDEFHEFRREIRNEIDESLRNHRREIRAELDEEVRLLRQKISELN